MTSNYYLATVEPNMDITPGIVFDDGDTLWDWTPFEIPKGPAALLNIHAIEFGSDGVASALDEDITLFFARSINGIAPTSLGTQHGQRTAATTTPSRRNIIGATYLDRGVYVDNAELIGFNTWSNTNTPSNQVEGNPIAILQGDPAYASTEGYQTIWVAGVTASSTGEFLFDSSVALAMAGSATIAADMTGASVALTVSGTNALTVFTAGDKIIGSTGGPTMEVVSVTDATNMAVKNISEQIDDGEILNPRSPFMLQFGLKY